MNHSPEKIVARIFPYNFEKVTGRPFRVLSYFTSQGRRDVQITHDEVTERNLLNDEEVLFQLYTKEFNTLVRKIGFLFKSPHEGIPSFLYNYFRGIWKLQIEVLNNPPEEQRKITPLETLRIKVLLPVLDESEQELFLEFANTISRLYEYFSEFSNRADLSPDQRKILKDLKDKNNLRAKDFPKEPSPKEIIDLIKEYEKNLKEAFFSNLPIPPDPYHWVGQLLGNEDRVVEVTVKNYVKNICRGVRNLLLLLVLGPIMLVANRHQKTPQDHPPEPIKIEKKKSFTVSSPPEGDLSRASILFLGQDLKKDLEFLHFHLKGGLHRKKSLPAISDEVIELVGNATFQWDSAKREEKNIETPLGIATVFFIRKEKSITGYLQFSLEKRFFVFTEGILYFWRGGRNSWEFMFSDQEPTASEAQDPNWICWKIVQALQL